MKIIFNPFEKIATGKLLAAGILFTVCGGFLAYHFNARFDGALDLHFTADVPLHIPFLELLIDISCTGLLLFAAARQINARTRHIDIFCAVLLSRLPLYLATPANSGGRLYEVTENLRKMASPNDLDINPGDMLLLILFGFGLLLFIVWLFALLWNGFRVACNAKGQEPVFWFIGAIIVAEIITKLINIYIL